MRPSNNSFIRRALTTVGFYRDKQYVEHRYMGSSPPSDVGSSLPNDVCGSTGPRINNQEERPRCAQELGHDGQHRGFPGSGFEDVIWGEPIMRDVEFATSYQPILASSVPESEERPDTTKLREAAAWWTQWIETPKPRGHGWGAAITEAADWIDAHPAPAASPLAIGDDVMFEGGQYGTLDPCSGEGKVVEIKGDMVAIEAQDECIHWTQIDHVYPDANGDLLAGRVSEVRDNLDDFFADLDHLEVRPVSPVDKEKEVLPDEGKRRQSEQWFVHHHNQTKDMRFGIVGRADEQSARASIKACDCGPHSLIKIVTTTYTERTVVEDAFAAADREEQP